MRPLILTARLDDNAQSYFNGLREQHFPPERNYLAAHLTLFHALPGLELSNIDAQISNTVSHHLVLAGRATGLRSLGHGVAFVIECPQLRTIRASLAKAWHCLLAPQDQQVWQPHITVQNKVRPQIARDLLQRLSREFQPKPVQFRGLDLWHYNGGMWDPAQSYSFIAKLTP